MNAESFQVDFGYFKGFQFVWIGVTSLSEPGGQQRESI
jgi:hypothetical protein